MASCQQQQQQFPPQNKQYSQPGKEYLMDPRPQFATQGYTPSNKLQGKVALVTGGDSGIGRAVCHYFALEGATVAFTYVKGQEDIDAEETLEILRKAKTPDAKDPMATAADLGFEENCKRVVDEVVKAYGKIDVLVNNAAEQYEGSIEEISEQRLERIFRINIFFSLLYEQVCIEAYEGRKLNNQHNFTDCNRGFTRALALQVLEKGIRVNGVAPGPIWTPLQAASLTEEEITQFGLEVPMKRAGQPFEVAPCYVFLAGNYCSSYISGQVLHPNGCTIVNG
ncbi:hypothetical protein ACOSQ3_008853 [Xanthoceras sorbifolium]